VIGCIMRHTGVKSPVLIGITGGSGSGKTTLAHLIQAWVQSKLNMDCELLSQDHYYIDQSKRFTGDGESVNFDHPDALDWFHLANHLEELKQGRSVEIPVYDFSTHKRSAETTLLGSSSVILVDGTLILSQPNIRKYFKEVLFVDTPEEIRYARRLNRDTHERGRTPEGVRKQFLNHVKPMHDLYVEPFKSLATQIVSGTDDFTEMVGKLAALI
jgi:uridine kinase